MGTRARRRPASSRATQIQGCEHTYRRGRQFRQQLEDIERTRDYAAKRRIVELLVSRIRVDTETPDGRKTARLTINYAFAGSRDCTAGFSIGTPISNP
jgi:hypothetical protein